MNEKFQELECKMFEVEQCFKEANRRDVHEVQRKDYNDSRCPSGSVHNTDKVSAAYRFRVAESRKTTDEYTSDGIITNGWVGINHKSTGTEETKLENQIAKDGSGDAVQTSKASSQDSCKTMVESPDKSRPHLLNRQCAKGIFTMNRIDNRIVNEPKHESSKPLIFEENNKSIEVDLLEKSKKLILDLIDKELKKLENKANEVDKIANNHKNLKIECIQNIEKELKTLAKLESLE